jgi:hypothetical protein
LKRAVLAAAETNDDYRLETTRAFCAGSSKRAPARVQGLGFDWRISKRNSVALQCCSDTIT